ncbi:HtaA domain-containing protein [Microbacterium thalassium]|uniref:Htaa domain-containing protein n=1 Tax=Microbacterium thalassium TaxID=362649 RepID=A0A7X0FM04_9MICO|nr:HtaA domain-containing protein [Microbacterium thalassium]MBB6389967.1 hypothetical protein [Microbacterium thalassium]GLK24653.1 hypothetical protein GCM10017607_19710 [Microbacterium thalassium]
MDDSLFTARADLGFAWSVKDTFLQYIRRMRDGDIAWSGGAAVTSGGEFFFPLAGVRRFSDCDVLTFRGSVVFTAHHGMLSVAITQPRITLRDGFADLSVHVGESETHIATVQLPRAIRDGNVAMWLECPVALTGGGPELFGGTYTDGEQLAPLTVRVPAGAIATSGEGALRSR